MKKLLSLILALMLIVGMLPTAFANTADEPITVTYNFTKAGHSKSSDYEDDHDQVEHKSGTKYYKDLNTEDAKGGAWAYLGTTTATSYKNDTNKRIIYISDTLTQFYLQENTYVAYRIQVPANGTYKVKEYKPYLFRNSTATDIKMYIVPMDEELRAKLDADNGLAWTDDPANKGINRSNPLVFTDLGITASPLGTYNAYTDTTQVAAVDVEGFGVIKNMQANTDYALILHTQIGGQTGISSLTLEEVVPEPTVQFIIPDGGYKTYNGGTVQLDSKLIAANGTDVITDATVSYTSNNASASVDNAGLVTGVSAGDASITATYTYNGKTYSASVGVTVEKVDKKHEFTLNMHKIADSALEAAGITKEGEDTTAKFYLNGNEINGLTDLSFVDTYEDISDKNKWCIANDLCECSEMELHKSYWKLVGNRANYLTDNGDNLGALKVKVEYNGTYNITARLGRDLRGTEVDVYVVSESEAPQKVTQAYLKTLTPAGRLSGIGEENTNFTIGNLQLTEGNYYIIFNMNTDNSTATDKGKQYFFLRYIWLIESDGTTTDTNAPADAKVKTPVIGVTSTLPGASISIQSPATVGGSITLTVAEEEGYKFIGWMRGVKKNDADAEMENTSKFIDPVEFIDLVDNGDGTYSYTAWTNAFLTAVYEPVVKADEDEPKVGFWNGDGSFLGYKTVSALSEEVKEYGGLPQTSLIGYTFRECWTAKNVALTADKLSSLTAAVTNAVAQFDAKDALNGEYDFVTVNGEQKGNGSFGETIECTDKNPSKVTHWLRDGKVVSYSKTYNYYVWDGTSIYSSYAAIENKPIVVLDKTVKTDDDGSKAYMIEYDKGNADAIVEVGILFGTETPVIGSTFEKFSSQKSDSHGQFAAKAKNAANTVARGYMIYKDGAEYKVIYSE